MRVFLSFANTAMIRSLDRISRQARSMNFYDEVYSYTESQLDENFLRRHKQQLLAKVRGFGYWCWKPQAIFQVLDTLKDGDILQYTDAGCHLNRNGLSRLVDYFDYAHKSSTGILAFQSKAPDYLLPMPIAGALDLSEYKWVKGDLFDYFGVRNCASITHSQTIGAGVVFIRKCVESMKFIDDWRSVVESNFALIDDTPSISSNLEGFIEHRHDQAIFSLLCKINNVDTLSAYEYWYPSQVSKGPDWAVLEKFPIHAKRDKDFGVLLNFENLARRVFAKIQRSII